MKSLRALGRPNGRSEGSGNPPQSRRVSSLRNLDFRLISSVMARSELISKPVRLQRPVQHRSNLSARVPAQTRRLYPRADCSSCPVGPKVCPCPFANRSPATRLLVSKQRRRHRGNRWHAQPPFPAGDPGSMATEILTALASPAPRLSPPRHLGRICRCANRYSCAPAELPAASGSDRPRRLVPFQPRDG